MTRKWTREGTTDKERDKGEECGMGRPGRITGRRSRVTVYSQIQLRKGMVWGHREVNEDGRGKAV